MTSGQLPDSATIGWSAPDAVHYFVTHRRRLDELYPSERRFFDTLLTNANSILDIGCAAGGMAEIVGGIRPDIQYCGVDVSPRLIEIARQMCPSAEFRLIDGRSLPFPDASVDSVLSLGVLHMTGSWKTLLVEARRVSRRKLLFDLRLHSGAETLTGKQKLMYSGKWDGISEAPYIMIGTKDIRGIVDEFAEEGRLSVYGYWHEVSLMTEAPLSSVCMAAFLLERSEGRPGERRVELPDEFRSVFC